MMTYPVMEVFYSIQGEGKHSGQAAYFIRLGGCDVGCVWCDVKESWDATAHPNQTVEQIVEGVQATKAKLVILTGGEPAMYNLFRLCAALKAAGYQLHIETSGAYPLQGEFDWVCCSPKKFKPALDEVLQRADELKVIAFNTSDFEWARAFEARVSPDCLLFMQAEWSKRERMYPLVVDFVKNWNHWHISVQTHNYLQID
jgi:organic radical activating enzyme